ncbi:hypothetical protein [Hydrogenophaga sp. NFH-34]|uniref:hypothetical protein n=1 Tax=Hydrogenophaga sp. NFH-34 TaxID=2744446 RepID=UPI001F33B706|nr:hypothetical protein [Hydrogenophaga sp. NFH-34]
MEPANLLELARSFRQWAIDNGLKDRGIDGGHGRANYDDALVDSFQISAQGAAVLQRRVISFVGIKRRENKILVFTSKKITLPEEKLLSKKFAGVDVEYLHSGAPVAFAGMGANYYQTAAGAYCCGSSIHPARYAGAGTMGALVRDEAGILYGLTNNHVTGDCNFTDAASPVLAPGHIDIQPHGIDPFTIGYHHRTLPMVSGSPDNVAASDNSDAALFRIKDESLVSSMQGVYHDTPVTTKPLMDGMIVEKVGRTTSIRQGVVVAQMVGFEPCLYSINALAGGKSLVYFDSPFILVGAPGQPKFSEPGDSGSLVSILENGQRHAAGLLYAGNGEGYTFVLPIEPILSNLQVSLVSGHNL